MRLDPPWSKRWTQATVFLQRRVAAAPERQPLPRFTGSGPGTTVKLLNAKAEKGGIVGDHSLSVPRNTTTRRQLAMPARREDG